MRGVFTCCFLGVACPRSWRWCHTEEQEKTMPCPSSRASRRWPVLYEAYFYRQSLAASLALTFSSRYRLTTLIFKMFLRSHGHLCIHRGDIITD